MEALFLAAPTLRVHRRRLDLGLVVVVSMTQPPAPTSPRAEGVTCVSVFDSDTCPGGPRGHRYDDDCNWRSPVEREAHIAAVAMLQRFPTLGADGPEETVASVIDAIYERGLVIARG